MKIEDRLNAIENGTIKDNIPKKEYEICSYCGNKDITVDRDLFDGLCASCTDKALYNPTIYEKAIINNKILRR